MQLPYITPAVGTPDEPNLIGVAFAAGRVTGTVIGREAHITINATCKAKVESKWKQVPFSEASHVFLTVPSADGEWADKIGTFYPTHSAGKWAGHWFDEHGADIDRVKAAKYVLAVAFGAQSGTHVLKSEFCLRCGREITHPDSIGTGFGPECIKKIGAFMPNRSGTEAGAHQKKNAGTATDTQPPADNYEAPLSQDFLATVGALSDAQLQRAIENAKKRGDDRRAREYERAAAELHKGLMQSAWTEEDEREAQAIDATVYEPPTPDVDAAAPIVTREASEDGLRYVLRAGDDPAAVLARVDKPAPAAAPVETLKDVARERTDDYAAWRDSPEGSDAYNDMRQEAFDAARDEL